MKHVLRAFVFLLILTSCALANAGPVRIEAGSDGITGSADAAPLGQVLTVLAEKIGCDIYIDAPLVDVPVFFNIKEKLTPEKTIQRIVRPYSYAMVFDSESTEGEPRILEVWIFRKGEQHSASYLPLQTEDTHSTDASGSSEAKDSRGAAPLGTLTEPGRTIDGKDMVRRDLHVNKSAFGTPVVESRDKRNGPDYRPSAHEMRLAYERYQLAKQREELRMAEMALQQSRTNFERNRQAYLSKRNQELKGQIQK